MTREPNPPAPIRADPEPPDRRAGYARTPEHRPHGARRTLSFAATPAQAEKARSLAEMWRPPQGARDLGCAGRA